jgi:cyanophycinase
MKLLATALMSILLYAPWVRPYCEAGTTGSSKGWLVIHGGGFISDEVIERFVSLAGGRNSAFVVIPTALADDIDLATYGQAFSKQFGVTHIKVLHTKDRGWANSDAFIEPLRHASGVWIDGGRQWRLADAYLDTAVETEIKALLRRGGVVGGSSAGATIQGSFLIRGAPGTPSNPEGNNRIMMVPGHEKGFGLLADSAIDQHINTRGRERDLDSVVAAHPELLGIGIVEGAAIVVHGGSFFVIGGRVAIHDGTDHQGAGYYFLSPGETFNLRTRAVDASDASRNRAQYPLTLSVLKADRTKSQVGVKTVGSGLLNANQDLGEESKHHILFECNVSLYASANKGYPARRSLRNELVVAARETDTDKVREFTCNIR